MPKQYRIFYKRGDSDFSVLEPGSHAKLYDRPEVTEAVDVLRRSKTIEGVALRVGDEQYNVIAFEQEAIAPRSFVLPRV